MVTIFALFALLVLSYLIWGERFEQLLAGEDAVEYLRSFGPWAWLVAIGLFIADIVLPIPATAVLATLGIIYGPWLGGLIGTAGSFLSGSIAYLACRALGRRGAMLLMGEKNLERSQRFFSRAGGWTVALSRWMIILPEMIGCLAGLTRMPAKHYFIALACGTIPMCFTYTYIGANNTDRPVLALTISAAVPVLLWPIAQLLIKKEVSPEEPSQPR